jgi:16S rRNA (guanine527-N7)-methyltransferase
VPHRRLEQLGAEYALTDEARERLEQLLALLATAPDAPTTVTDPDLAVDVHVADSLSGLAVPALHDADRVADLGSGAGFPALVLAVALPDAQVTAVESTRRKCDFIREAAAALELGNLSVACSRVEEWDEGLAANDVVCARAVAPLGVLCEYAAPLLTVGGALIAWKARVDDDEREVAVRAATELGLSEPALVPVQPYPGSEHRHLAVAIKQQATPERFPRRTGVALKRPLGVRRPNG